MRLIPPIAMPVGVGTIAASVTARAKEPSAAFAGQLAARFRAENVAVFGSGRAALAAVLSTSLGAGRDEVLVPAYTCWSVPAAAVRVGCRVRLYDIEPGTFLPTPALWNESRGRVATVVLADLLSPSPEFESAANALVERFPDCLIIEDRAQSWPSLASSRGVTLLSFGRGKPMPLGHGGALLSCARRLDVTVPAARRGGLTEAAALAATAILGQPALFRIPSLIPASGVGSTVFDPLFDGKRPFWDWQDRLGSKLLERMDELLQRRSRHAAQLASVVDSVQGWEVGPWSQAPLRLPVYATDRAIRDRMLTVLRRLGVAASALYPGTLLEIPALRPHLVGDVGSFPGAQEISDRLLTLPVYPTLTSADVEHIGRAFLRAARRVRE